MSPSSNPLAPAEPTRRRTPPDSGLADLRRWAYEQTSEHSTAKSRLEDAENIIAWVLGEAAKG